ncbi:hypothetical protein BDQ17DRAFT_1368148 [Cyathus striatus]|nr:hypothetical protein BDQ17DRAFT_1378513 [Cyathus striatus]KAF8993549.1 hypothetical protein BDQ17DRAFT_1368148 [Cyathus striatus]
MLLRPLSALTGYTRRTPQHPLVVTLPRIPHPVAVILPCTRLAPTGYTRRTPPHP